MHRLKSLEKEIKTHEYCPNQIGYFFCCEFVDMTLDDLKPLKELLVKHKIIGPDNSLETVKAEDPQPQRLEQHQSASKGQSICRTGILYL